MMKTKLTLFVTVLAVALFGIGCASTDPANVRTYLHTEVFSNDAGIYIVHHTPHRCTGRIVLLVDGELMREFIVVDGIKNGYFRSWHKKGVPHVDAIFKDGKAIMFKEWLADGKLFSGGADSHWNPDGTPRNR